MTTVNVPTLGNLQKTTESKFRQLFGEEPTICVWAPGRVNLIGEHTDYNNGFVFPMALPMVTVIVAKPREDPDDEFHFHTTHKELGDGGFSSSSSSSSTEPQIATFKADGRPSDSCAKWTAYVRGVIVLFEEHGGPKPPAMNAVVASSVPLGGGLSSSAALEVATYMLCCESTGYHRFSKSEAAKICQIAEHTWVGSNCGIMDQLASLEGLQDFAIFIDCMTNQCTPVKTNFEPSVKVVIVDSGVHHSIASSEYNVRRGECQRVADHFKVTTLRGLQERAGEVLELCAETKLVLGEVPAKRLHHILTENLRVIEAHTAMINSDFDHLGRLMRESHTSLKDDYAVSCSELDELVAIANSTDGVYGARMTGGGFGGSIVVLVKTEAVPQLLKKIEEGYSKKALAYVVEASNGAGVTKKP